MYTEPVHDLKAVDTGVSRAIGRIKETVSSRRKKKKRKFDGQGGMKYPRKSKY